MSSKLLLIVMLLAILTFEAKSQDEPPTPCEAAETTYNLLCTKQKIVLVDDNNKISIKVYTKTKMGKLIDKTFVVVHPNEKKGLDAAKKVISENYGRLVEVVTNFSGTTVNPNDNKERYLYFGVDGASCVDPNRIFTKEGIKSNLQSDENRCKSNNPFDDENDKILTFGKKLINVVTDNNKYKFIIGIHNNDDSEEGISLNSFSEKASSAKTAIGIFKANEHPKEITDIDDFILVSDVDLMIQMLRSKKYFNVALQENKKYLDANPKLDDGSMSIYFGKKVLVVQKQKTFFYYINIEAEGKENENDVHKQRQSEAIKMVINDMTKPKP